MELEFFRKKIDKIDEEIIKLLSQRFEIVKEIGAYKKNNNLEILQKNRFEEVLKTRKEMAKKLGLKEDFIEGIWYKIHDYALFLEK